MDLFKDKTGLKVISVGFLLGMVSYLHGMPANNFSLSVRGDKVVLVYSGQLNELDASAFEFINAASLINNQVIVIDGAQHLVSIDHLNEPLGVLMTILPNPQGYNEGNIPDQQNSVVDVSLSKGVISIGNTALAPLACYSDIYYNRDSVTSPTFSLSSANATRAGPIA